MMRVSAGIVRYPDGRILICRRGEGRKNAHLWEFPGGKQEAGESPEDALRRELLEELSLPIADVSPLCRREAQGIAFDFLTATATRAGADRARGLRACASGGNDEIRFLPGG